MSFSIFFGTLFFFFSSRNVECDFLVVLLLSVLVCPLVEVLPGQPLLLRSWAEPGGGRGLAQPLQGGLLGLAADGRHLLGGQFLMEKKESDDDRREMRCCFRKHLPR